MKSFVRGLALLAIWSCSAPPDPVPPPAASAGRFTIECAERAVRAYDASRTVIDGVPIECSVHLAQRDGQPLAGRSITVLAEAGRFTIEPATSADGTAALRLETGMPLPLDVVPGVFTQTPAIDAMHTGEPLAPMWMAPYEWSEDLTPGTVFFTLREPRRPDPVRLKTDGTRYENNPRDNLVTVVAWTEGEEAFVDANANGTFDTGELFTDLTEPFLDADDDGTRGPSEEFVDTHGNGQWDGKNSVWESQTRIWVQQRVLWTGTPAQQDLQPTVLGVTGHRPTFFPTPTPIALVCPPSFSTCTKAGVPWGQPFNLTIRISDPWFNRLAHEEPDNGCSVGSSPLVVMLPTRFELRRSDVWPSAEFLQLSISDSRAAPSPRRVPGAPFSVSLACDFSPRRGQPAERVVFDGLQGTIE
jgi:hypothetical protein